MLKLPKDNFILLETNRFDKDNFRSFLFHSPARIISCYELEDVKKSFEELENFISNGYYIAGFISYEAGFSFEETLKGLRKKFTFPLLWFGVYKKPIIFTHREKLDLIKSKKPPYVIKNLHPNITKKEYINNISRIKELIRRGDTYQVNYTFKYKFDFSGSGLSFYEDLKEKQSVSYSGFIKTPQFTIISLSPELFFRKQSGLIEVRPMKGTIDRGRDLGEDAHNAEILKNSLKNRSENLMIVDLLRNDLGRISESGTVKTEKLFDVEKYETLHQMISIVRSALKKGIGIYDLFKSIFPSGSVTGAPKISTMKIINSLEKGPRSIYTGSIGFFSPNREAIFNVAIRTLLIDNLTKKGEIGVGGGIVYDSDPYKEFEECRLKASFMLKRTEDFKLIETILWRKKKYFLLNLHLERLLCSAMYFNFKYDRKYILKKVKALEKNFDARHDYKIRLLLGKNGETELNYTKLQTDLGEKKVKFSDQKMHSMDLFLFHKTTNRDLYDKEYKIWKNKGYFDIIFANEKNQITEGTISNIIIKKRKFYYTPPIECGLLNGVFRRHLFENKKFPLKEKILYKSDIMAADEIYMANSVRGMIKVNL